MKRRRKSNRGLTMVEVLLLLGICVCVFIMVLPALLAAREKTRRATCLDNMKRLAYACQYYATAQRLLIASSGVTRDAEGKIVAVDGWSCLALVLPYVDKGRSSEGVTTKDLYDRLDIAHGRPLTEPEGAKGTPHADMLAMRLPGLLCPSCGGSPYSDLDGKKAAITSYHPLDGAGHNLSWAISQTRSSATRWLYSCQPLPLSKKRLRCPAELKHGNNWVILMARS